MKNKYKIILIICVIIGICSILVGSIAYYRIVVEGSIKGSTGNAVFVLKDENSNVWNNKEINLGKVNPGDSGEFTVTMDASGSTVDMYATLEIERNTLPTNLKFYTTSDHKSELHKYYSFLEKSGTSRETLTIYWYWNPYISDEEDSKFINIDNIEANVKVSAVQISEYAMMKNGVSYIPSTHTYNGTEFWSDDYRPYIRMINFSNDLSNLPENCNDTNLCFDVSNSSSQIRKVYAYLVDSGLKGSNNSEQSLYNLYIVSEAPIFAPIDCSFMFSNFNNLEILNFNNNFNTSFTTNMFNMFGWVRIGDPGSAMSNNGTSQIVLLANTNSYRYSNSLNSLDLGNFNTSKVTDMMYMFSNCESLTALDLSNFNTSKVTNMKYMFFGCSSLTSLDLSCFNTSKVLDMGSMFSYCESLIKLELNSFNTSQVTNMISMFSYCCSLTSIDLSNFNTSNVTVMGNMFESCSSLTSLDLGSFNTSKVIDMMYMFYDCKSLTNLDLGNFNTSQVTNMMYMFCGCSSLLSLDLSNFNTTKLDTILSSMFYNCSSLVSLNLSGFKRDMSSSDTFSGCSSLKYLNINNCYFGEQYRELNVILEKLKDCTNLITTINITNFNYDTTYNFAYLTNAKITINYTSNCEAKLDAYLAAHPDYNWVKGKLITAPTSN